MAQTDNSVYINEILQNGFSSYSYDEKKRIISSERPCPELNITTAVILKKSNNCTRHFRKALYNITDWICGCSKVNKFYCWPCLLFSSKKTIWNQQGYDDLNHLNTAIKKHSETEIHITSNFKLKTFFSSTSIDILLDKQKRIDINLHNQKVRVNREILKRLINAVCYLAKQELPFRGHHENNDSYNRGNYMELLLMTQEFDPLLKMHLDQSTVFRGTSVTIQNDLILSIADVLKDEIFNEIQETYFVAIMLDVTSDITNKSQLSTVLRYFSVKEKKVVERFLQFDDISVDKTAQVLFNHVCNVVETFKCGTKLVAQTYDGAAVMSGHLNGLQSKVLEKYPKALFTYCYAHVINLVLLQSLECNKEMRIFFRELKSLQTFFSHSSKVLNTLSEFMKNKLSTLVPTRWNFTSRLIHTVNDYREPLIEFFKYVSEYNGEDDYGHEARITALGLKQFLEQFKHVFFIKVLATLLSFTDVLFNISQSKIVDIYSSKINEFQNKLQLERASFEKVWTSVVESVGYEPKEKRRKTSEDFDKMYYEIIYIEIMDNIQSQIEIRFNSFENLQYFDLLNPLKFKEFTNKEQFPYSIFKKLLDLYPDIFNFNKLQNELHVWYKLKEVSDKTPIEALNYLNEFNLKSGFSEIYKLCQLISTIPATPSSIERSFSAHKRIQTHCRSTQSVERMNNLSLISIEKELLSKLRKDTSSFYKKVTSKFILKERRIELEYK